MHHTCPPLYFPLSDNGSVDENRYTHVPLKAIKGEGSVPVPEFEPHNPALIASGGIQSCGISEWR